METVDTHTENNEDSYPTESAQMRAKDDLCGKRRIGKAVKGRPRHRDDLPRRGASVLTFALRWSRTLIGLWSILNHPIVREWVAPLRELIMAFLGLG